jgi:hypothetical protein
MRRGSEITRIVVREKLNEKRRKKERATRMDKEDGRETNNAKVEERGTAAGTPRARIAGPVVGAGKA